MVRAESVHLTWEVVEDVVFRPVAPLSLNRHAVSGYFELTDSSLGHIASSRPVQLDTGDPNSLFWKI
jgi:hypothetical protein